MKTSGSRGLQVYAPLYGGSTYAQTKRLAKAIAELLEEHWPERVVSRMARALRRARC